MKIFTSWVSIGLVIALLLVCIVVLVDERSQDSGFQISEYEFSLTFGPNGRSSINTFTNTITKDLVADGVIVTDFVLSQRDRNKIKRMLGKMDILSYPMQLEVRRYSDHVENIYLHVIIDGAEHMVSWRVPWDFDFNDGDRLSDLHKDFIEFVNFVKELVVNSDEYKALPEANGGYL